MDQTLDNSSENSPGNSPGNLQGNQSERSAMIVVESRDELISTTSAIIKQTSRTLDIVSRHLDPFIYDQPETVELIKQVALGSRRAQIRILVNNIGPVIRRGHRLIDLAQRLSSYISIRVPGQSHKNFNEALLIADNSAYIHHPFADRYEGEAHYQDRGRARRLTSRFEELWEKADTDPSLRKLHI